MVRFFEIMPGALTWATLLGAPILSYYKPAWISLYIILFDLYWFLKAGNVAIHLLQSYGKLKGHNKIDWLGWCKEVSNVSEFKSNLTKLIATEKKAGLKRIYQDYLTRIEKLPKDRNFDWTSIYHLILLPTYREDYEVLAASIESYVKTDFPNDKLIFVLATEERGGASALENAKRLKEKFEKDFYKFIVAIHPDGIEGEAKVKGANMTYAAKKAKELIDELQIPYERVIISGFDADTTTSKNYFSHLTFDYLTHPKPMQASYQPMPMFHNNIWDTPAVARVIASASSFWQLVEASRPDRLITFSSHSMSFKTLIDVDYWRVDIIPDDSHIFWQCFLHFKGDYQTLPLFTTVSMDAVLGESYIGTLIAQYKQKKRWAWGVTEQSLVFPLLFKDKAIPAWKRFLYAERLIEGHYFWSTGAIMVAILGWLPLLLGGERFGGSVLANNLPYLTRLIMTIATFFLVFSMYINMVLLPPRPARYSRWKSISMILQWVFTPIVSSVFGSMPAIDAQTRLMFGKYMEFWVTPKIRRPESVSAVNNLEKEGVKVK